MSGIEELKQKAKLSMDEMFDSHLVGETEKNQAVEIETHLTRQAEKKQTSKLREKETKQTNSNPNTQKNIQPENQTTNNIIRQINGKLDVKESGLMENQKISPTSIFPTQQIQTQKTPTCKMTFNLTEEIYKAFNDLYAKRMLQGRKTEKSDLICEAIQWLIKMEEQAY